MIAVLTRAAHYSRCRISVIFILALCLIGTQVLLAQVTPPITSSGLNSQVSVPMNLPSGKVQYDITGGTRPGNGANLFHSFGEFGVPTNNIANFLNDSGLATSNILGRVTGGNPSNIFGTIQTTGFGSANLFLMNPAGIVFGPNASLNVGGSASFTTADYLRLADGARFNALPGPQDAFISSAPVAAFGFLGINPAAITVQGGQLAVSEGQAVSLVGGDITIEGATLAPDTIQPARISAPGGQINLASVASPGEITAGTLDYAANVNNQSFGALGTIQISQESVVNASGDGGGTVLIRGGRFIVDDSTISANTTGPAIGSLTGPPGAGIDIQVTRDAVIRNVAVLETNVAQNVAPGIGSGGVQVKADRIEILGVPPTPQMQPFTGIRSDVDQGSTGGRSGDIKLEANSILVNFGQVETLTQGAGNAGNIIVVANQNIELDNRGSIASGSQISSANGGNIELTSTHGNIVMNTPFVTVQANSSAGNTGDITVSAPRGDIVLAGGSLFVNVTGPGATGGTGGGGRIQLTANNLQLNGMNVNQVNGSPLPVGNLTVTLSGNLSLRGNSRIFTTTRGSAPSADLNITAHDVLVTNGSFLSTETTSSGPGGRLNISADNVQMTNGGQIRSGSTIGRLPRGLLSVPSGAGGIIAIQGRASPAGSVTIDGVGSGITTNAQGTGAGGNIGLATESLSIQNSGTISASTSGTAPSATGGNIAISAGQLVSLNNGGSITASSTGPANAGNIAINAGAQFLSRGGSVTTQASQASGGNITVQATDAIRLVNGQINTSVQGGPTTAGGNITIDPAVMTLQNSQILARATRGQGGNINIIAGTFLADQTSRVDASAQEGISGTVNIQSPVSNLSGTLATLPQRPLQVQHLLSQRCAAQTGGRLSSLVVAGPDTLPAEPGGWLMSPLALMADEGVPQPGQPATSHSVGPSRQMQVCAGPISDRLGPLPQRGVAGWAAGCGS